MIVLSHLLVKKQATLVKVTIALHVKKQHRDGTPQCLRALDALPEDPGSIPRWQLTVIHNSTFKGPNTLFWSPWALPCIWYTDHACSQNTHTLNKMKEV